MLSGPKTHYKRSLAGMQQFTEFFDGALIISQPVGQGSDQVGAVISACAGVAEGAANQHRERKRHGFLASEIAI
ncbi:MAG: hypothetical protein GY772_19745 [bacterium]|nr:hypothetical protein [bacterium]